MSPDEKPTDYYPSRSKWVRALYTIVILVGYGFSEALLWFLAVVQFISVIFRGEPNLYIYDFSDGLTKWNTSAISFCLWKTEKPPFPFSRWPDGRL
jgi:hypothetical protein